MLLVGHLVDNSSDSSEPESISEAEVDAEVRSTTSVEDISSLTANMLLYKAARARNVFVMMDALAQSAQINWMNEEDYGRTPLIQAIHSVCDFSSHLARKEYTVLYHYTSLLEHCVRINQVLLTNV